LSKSLFITSIPAFYKLNLYNELCHKIDIDVIFLANGTNEKRADDFITINADFPFEILSRSPYQKRNPLHNIIKIIKSIKNGRYERVIIGGWDAVEYWFILFFVRKVEFQLVLESSIEESSTNYLKSKLKIIFLSKISRVYASGKKHKKLLDYLGYNKETVITNGVGIINKGKKINPPKIYQKNFLFVGRIEKVKNLQFLISVFNNLPKYNLNIIGVGPEEVNLKKRIKGDNIRFLGSIPNNNLSDYFLKTNFLILPSVSEPWGLVIEEALYNKIPVILSSACGSSDLVNDYRNGYLIDPYNQNELIKILKSIDQLTYSMMLKNIDSNFIDKKDQFQVNAYL